MKCSSFAPGVHAVLLFPLFLAWIIGRPTPARAQDRPGASYHEIYVSPDIKCHQGYATDGTNHYTFDNQAIYKWRDDLNWSLVASNKTPFAGVSGLNHFGDGDYFQGKLYIVAEIWQSCANFTNQSILVFDAATLARLEVHSVSAQHHEVSGLAVAPRDGAGGVIYVSSYCDGSKLFKYDLRTFEFLGPLPLDQTLSCLQGVAWHDGRFYAPEDGGAIYTFGGDGHVSRVYVDSHSGSHEGLKFVGNGLRWLIDEGPGKQRIHYISMTP
ncbi:MAG: hypothetical protein ABSC18_09715 [Verrucomicrobiota bacterium]|jgi:hypothetical protein